MPEHSKPSASARLSIFYITLGALMGVWTVLYYVFYLVPRVPDRGSSPYFWCYGFFFTGLTLMAIGFAVGQIGRAARHAEVPPPPLDAARPVVPAPQPAVPAPGTPVAVVPTAAPAGIPVAAAPGQGVAVGR
jgi:hypothetical protein